MGLAPRRLFTCQLIALFSFQPIALFSFQPIALFSLQLIALFSFQLIALFRCKKDALSGRRVNRAKGLGVAEVMHDDAHLTDGEVFLAACHTRLAEGGDECRAVAYPAAQRAHRLHGRFVGKILKG